MNINPLQPLPTMLGDGWKRGLEFAEEAARAGPATPPAVGDSADPGVLRAARHVPVRRDARVPRRAHRCRPAEALLRDRRCATRCAHDFGRHRGAGARVQLGRDTSVARADRAPRVGRLHACVELARRARASTRRRVPRRVARRGPAHRLHARRLAGAAVAPRIDRRDRRAPARPAWQQRRGRAPHLATAASTTRRGCSPSTCPIRLSLEEAVRAARRDPRVALRVRRSRRRPRRRVGRPHGLGPGALGVGATRWVEDFPAGGGRFVVDAEGYRALVVNGQCLALDGHDAGRRAGRVLSPNAR